MKITHQIVLLVIFLLAVLGADTFIGLRHIANIRGEFFAMANDDVALMQDVGSIHQLQLEKGIFLQKLISIVEELGFGQVNPARKQYLSDQLAGMAGGLGHYKEQMALHLHSGQAHLGQAMAVAVGEEKQQGLRSSIAVLGNIAARVDQYDALIAGILKSAHEGGFQLSLEDLEQLQTKEGSVTADARALLKDVEGFVHASMAKTDGWQKEAKQLLFLSLLLSGIVAFILLAWIIVSIKTFNALNKRLRDANTELDDFIRIMGEDVVTPLTGMIAYCGYLEGHAGTAMDAKGLEALQGIRRSSSKMHAIVKDLLRFAESKRPKS